jgi:hypothetical protein
MNRSFEKVIVPCGCLMMALILSLAPALSGASGGFTINDPRGDDFGAGDLVYPNRQDMDQGSLDIERFEAEPKNSGTWFKVKLGRKIPDPKGQLTYVGKEPLEKLARYGFYTFNVDVYVDTDRISGSGRVDTLPGRNVSVASEDAWEKAIILTPRPEVARAYYAMHLEREREKQIEAETGRIEKEALDSAKREIEQQLTRQFFFPRQISVRGREIRFFVPDSFLGGAANEDWGYSVFITGCEVEQLSKVVEVTPGEFNLMVIPAARGRHRDRFGIINDADPNQAPVVDLLAPSVADQQRILTDYDSRYDRLAAVTAVSPSGRASEPGQGAAAPARPSPPGSTGGFSGRRPGVGTPGAVPAMPADEGSPQRRRTIPARLKTLNTLRDDGLISETEYQALRRKILSEI